MSKLSDTAVHSVSLFTVLFERYNILNIQLSAGLIADSAMPQLT